MICSRFFTRRSFAVVPRAALWLCAVLCLTSGVAKAEEAFTDRANTCTMKITPQEEEGGYLVGIICEQRKTLSYWSCIEPKKGGFSPFQCQEKKTQTLDKAKERQSQHREMRIYAQDIERVAYVLCGRLCDPTR